MFHHAIDLPTQHLEHLNDYCAPPGTVTPWELEDVQVLLEDLNLSPVKSSNASPIDLLKYLLLIGTMEKSLITVYVKH